MALHHLHNSGGIGLMVSNSIPIIERPSGKMELASKSRNRSLSSSDHSCTDSRRKTTTTPAKPASATAICAAMPRASPGSILSVLLLVQQTARANLLSFCAGTDSHYRFQPQPTKGITHYA